jgi:hypothetical protein
LSYMQYSDGHSGVKPIHDWLPFLAQ